MYGYRATVKGMVSDLGDGSDGVAGTPLLTDVALLDAGIGCDGNATGLSSGTPSSGSNCVNSFVGLCIHFAAVLTALGYCFM